jgi:hypothetical protein
MELVDYDFTCNLASSLWRIVASMRPCTPLPLILKMVILFPTLPLGCSPMKAFAMGATITIPITPPTHTKPNKEENNNNNNKRKTTLLELHLNPKAC